MPIHRLTAHLKVASLAWFVLDAAVVYLAFVNAYKLTTGWWMAYPPGAATAFGLTLGVYLGALWLSGIYRIRARDMHLPVVVRVAAFLLLAWAGSVMLAYLIVPDQMADRGLTAVHWMQCLIGVLGLRIVVRSARERHAQPLPDPAPASLQLADVVPQPRPRTAIDRAGLRNYLAGRTVLVTGAGGSIGATLSRLLLDLKPFRMVLVDVSEYNLFRIENALRHEAFAGEIAFRLADVRDEKAMHAIFDEFRPDLVLHAAAYKHVPLMERHPIEAFRNNTLATVSLLRLCEAFDAEQFIFISTDKAVHPTSVLGATKRLAEWYVKATNAPRQRKIVRFGNVFGSQGSVVPLFEEQIRNGGPVTVTHPEMERFFISADEACSLVFQTILLSTAPIYILRMESLRIQALAEAMVDHLQPRGAAVPITHTGLRPGEKLREALWDNAETPMDTAHPDILGLKSPAPYSRAELDAYLHALDALCTANRVAELRKALFRTSLDVSMPHLDVNGDHSA